VHVIFNGLMACNVHVTFNGWMDCNVHVTRVRVLRDTRMCGVWLAACNVRGDLRILQINAVSFELKVGWCLFRGGVEIWLVVVVFLFIC